MEGREEIEEIMKSTVDNPLPEDVAVTENGNRVRVERTSSTSGSKRKRTKRRRSMERVGPTLYLRDGVT